MVSTSTVQPKAYIAVLLVLGSTHLLNDLLQALIPAIYPIIKDKYALDFVQMGLIPLTFQIAGSLLRKIGIEKVHQLCAFLLLPGVVQQYWYGRHAPLGWIL